MIRSFTLRFNALILVGCLYALPALGQPYTFADVPWGTTRVRTRTLLQARGYTHTRTDGSTDSYRGRLMSNPVLVYAEFGETRGDLLKISVFLRTYDEGGGHVTRRVYLDLYSILVGRYGASETDDRFCGYPYLEDSDCFSNWKNALNLDKVTWVAFWPKRDETNLDMEISKNDAVAVYYESPGWAAELARRRAREVRDF